MVSTKKEQQYILSLSLGPFVDLNAEEVEEEVGNMWRTMHKLAKTFSDTPNPKRAAEVTKSKLDKFKQHLPLLQVFCNPGIRDRHWKRVRNQVISIVSIH